jgi:hypothetical protein
MSITYESVSNKSVEFYSMNELASHMKRNVLCWCWGITQYANFKDKILSLSVNAMKHKGYVWISVNGLDLFDIHILSWEYELKEKISNIYLEDLIEVIDSKIETN